MRILYTHRQHEPGSRDGEARKHGAKPVGLGVRAKAVATAAALAGGILFSGCTPLREFAAGYERELRFEYRTEQGSASYALRRPARDGKEVAR